MGNRAIIKPDCAQIGIYLHWNGGLDSVRGFLTYCSMIGGKGFVEGSCGEAISLLNRVISNFFGKGSVGIVPVEEDLGKVAKGLENGLYIVHGWDIVGRVGCCLEQTAYDIQDFMLELDKAQPEKLQISRYIKAEETPVSQIHAGDRVVWIDELDGVQIVGVVDGFSMTGMLHDGKPADGTPYVIYKHRGIRCCHYLDKETARVLKWSE